MKKLFYVLTLVLLLAVVPVSTIEAKTTKPDKPTVEVKYNTKSNKWLARFNCKTKGATIKCKDLDDGRVYTIKSGKWYNAYSYQAGKLYSVKGKTKSKVYTYDIKNYIDAKRSADMHKVVDKYVDKNADSFTKLAGIVDFFEHSGYYEYDYTFTRKVTNSLWYQRVGCCEVLADQFTYICSQYGIKSSKVRDCTADHAWNYVYINDTDPIIVDPTELVSHKEVSRVGTSNTFYDKYGKVTPSKRDKLEDGFSVLNLAGDAKFEKDKITVENDGYPGYTTIYTYSKKDGFWSERSWDANGIEAKYDPENDEYNWCWYYGDDYPDGCAALTEEEE